MEAPGIDSDVWPQVAEAGGDVARMASSLAARIAGAENELAVALSHAIAGRALGLIIGIAAGAAGRPDKIPQVVESSARTVRAAAESAAAICMRTEGRA